MAESPLEQTRENWGSRAGFVLAAVGSAVGLGNLWGFPYKVYDNGGGAFLIPYLIAMLLVGIPLLILEFSLGHMTQKAAPDAFRGINRKTEPVGWWGIILGFVIITYYPVILAYCLNFLIVCVGGIVTDGELPWAGEGLDGVKQAKSYFFNDYLNIWTQEDIQSGVKPWSFGGLVTPIALSLLAVWVLMYLCIFRGVKLVSKVVLWTVPLPWIMLMVLTIRGLTLPGAGEGLNFFLDPDWTRLANPETWRWAFGQMFFSMSLAFGVMITYASFLHRKSDINNNAAIIGLADIGTSFAAGIAVFATLGAMAFATQQAALVQQSPDLAVPVTEIVDGGPSLAFVAFPYALAQLPGSAWFGAVFFVALLTLGIDSAFSITESVLTGLVDKTGWSRGKTLIGMSLVGLAAGVIYCTRGGLNWLGTMDGFVNSTWGGICLLGLLECVVIGWAYRLGRLREHANERSDWRLGGWWEIIIRYIAPVLLSALFAWSLLEKLAGEFLYSKGELNLMMAVGVGVAIGAPILALLLSLRHSPGADRYAQHVGQPRTGRGLGVVAILLLLAATAAMVIGFAHVRSALEAGNAYIASLTALENVPPEDVAAPPEAIGRTLRAVQPTLWVALSVGVLAVIGGAMIVARAERHRRRPSGFARFSAGGGVMVIGAVAGVMLAAAILPPKLDKKHAAAQIAMAETPVIATTQPVETTTQTATAETENKGPLEQPRTHELTTPSYLVLTAMIALLVVGLAWCFFRAIKAAGTGNAATPQQSEGLDDEE
ncbi:MAG: sodium-dependent transporter [Phycisphaerae bacterium]